jgi:hypothetical protein
MSMTKNTLNTIINGLPSPFHLYGFRLIGGSQIIIAPDIRPTNNPQGYTPYEIDDAKGCIIFHTFIMSPSGPQIKVLRYIDIDSIVEVITFLPELSVAERTEYM